MVQIFTQTGFNGQFSLGSETVIQILQSCPRGGLIENILHWKNSDRLLRIVGYLTFNNLRVPCGIYWNGAEIDFVIKMLQSCPRGGLIENILHWKNSDRLLRIVGYLTFNNLRVPCGIYWNGAEIDFVIKMLQSCPRGGLIEKVQPT